MDPKHIERMKRLEAAKKIAWAHWKAVNRHDMAKDPEELWINLGDDNRRGYIAAAEAVA